MFGLGVPVIIGPMNGGMDYPSAFRTKRGVGERVLLGGAKVGAVGLNLLLPGKRLAARLIVANERTRVALRSVVRRPVVKIAENGVDLSVWASDPLLARPNRGAGV